jgi:ElaB/YqjD/DUF883 family membrane-anchored ribosome-binding protein
MDPKEDPANSLPEKEDKKQQLLANKEELSPEEIKRLRKEKKEAVKKAKMQKLKEAKQKKKEESKKQTDKSNNQSTDQVFDKPSKKSTPRRERADSQHDLPSGMDNVSVTVEEILEKYYGKLHYEIITLGLKLVAEMINGASLRCLAIIRALIKFTKDYQ